MDKKGFLVVSVLKMLLAIMGIGLLVYLAVMLFFPGDSVKEKFEKNLDEVMSVVKVLDKGETAKIVLIAPSGIDKEIWELIYVDEDLKNSGAYGVKNVWIPNSCKNNCLCACPFEEREIGGGTTPEIYKYELFCTKGVCKELKDYTVDETSDVVQGIRIDLVDIEIKKTEANVLLINIKGIEERLENEFSRLVDGIKNAEDGSNLPDVDLRENWFLRGFSKEDAEKPVRCGDNDCLCLCPEADLDSCKENGLCKIVEGLEVRGQCVNYGLSGQIVEERIKNCFSVNDIEKVSIRKQENLIVLTTNELETIFSENEKYLEQFLNEVVAIRKGDNTLYLNRRLAILTYLNFPDEVYSTDINLDIRQFFYNNELVGHIQVLNEEGKPINEISWTNLIGANDNVLEEPIIRDIQPLQEEERFLNSFPNIKSFKIKFIVKKK